MINWRKTILLAVLPVLAVALPGAGCIITIDPNDNDNTNGNDNTGGGGATTIRVRIINATGTTLDPQFYAADGPVTIDELFVPGRKQTRFGVGTLGLLGPQGQATIDLECAQAVVIGTAGGAFGDDLNNPEGFGRRIVLTQDVNIFCGDTLTLTYQRTSGGFDTAFEVDR